uniref:Uncharacterized protein n=1 Tax=Anguilla anguilla TaxID=7936 RepID=A0A0E9XBM9_ANGAN
MYNQDVRLQCVVLALSFTLAYLHKVVCGPCSLSNRSYAFPVKLSKRKKTVAYDTYGM